MGKNEDKTQDVEKTPDQTVDQVFEDEGDQDAEAGFAATAESASPVEQGPKGGLVQRQQEVRETAAKRVRTAATRPQDEPTHLIKLHNNAEIPPGGQYVGVNGRWIKIVPNVEMEVPESALEVLDNAVRLEPEVDEHNRVVGTREVPRFPYTFVRRPRPQTEA